MFKEGKLNEDFLVINWANNKFQLSPQNMAVKIIAVCVVSSYTSILPPR